MNIDNHIDNGKKALDTVRNKVAEQDYDAALPILCNVMSDTRELLEHVFALKSLQTECSGSFEENGP